MAQYDEILSNKSSLEFEINTYRRLLESEEAHVKRISSETHHHHHHSTTIQDHSPSHPRPSLPIRPPPQPQPPPPPSTTSTTTTTNNLIHDTKINQTEMQAKTTFQRSAKGSLSLFVHRRGNLH